MTLIKSISGIRGTIGGKPSENLTPIDIVKFTAAFATFIREQRSGNHYRFVVGRDARVSGDMVNHLVAGTLMGMGVDVMDVGLSTTPTVEMAVTEMKADGGIIITASHNPAQWNALKLLNHKGEFISDKEGHRVLDIAEEQGYEYASFDGLGRITEISRMIDKHINQILELPLVDVEAIKKAQLTVAVDAVNSTGGIAIPLLLKKLGVETVLPLYCEPTGDFPHNPEPLPENVKDLSSKIRENQADVGFVVDPDVDRLAILAEDGSMFGEEYTLVAVADYVLKNKKGDTVSNMSSTQALRDVTKKHGGTHYASAVGEVNVVDKMKAKNAVIGGEGNGGVIYPALHYGRDALVGIALFLSHLVKSEMKVSELRNTYPDYVLSKNKKELTPDMDIDNILKRIREKYENEYPINTEDGVKIEFGEKWVHLRKSNTEPIIRIYSESATKEESEELANLIIKDIETVAGE
ncbi:MAG: phosphoglucosamine mutase [Bacteroidales bacterium]|nr:phosphoglucosamine mutase [Bacteroidales bacterium]MCF8332959.1 phosphoglucosamine mutase [Bacteroidales bacterium]